VLIEVVATQNRRFVSAKVAGKKIATEVAIVVELIFFLLIPDISSHGVATNLSSE
jgi:hypothetical protein